MSHTADATQDHETRAVEEERMEKAVAQVRPGADGRSRWVLGELVTHKIPSYQTGGAYSLFEVTTQSGAGSPPHVQHREDESFYVLEGEFEFLLHGHTLVAGASSLHYVPKGTLHAHRNVGEEVGRLLVTQTPGGLYERFFEEVGKPVDGESGPLAFEARPQVDSIRAIASEYGIEILPPIPTEA
jgi:mannose-6-phosphate isomerase-like protein (cupin superfamily)